ncbi:MAG: plastocyanin/azurin family copper-binding protein, partial [Sphingobacterium sp.]
LIVSPGSRESVVKQAAALGAKGMAMNYIPKSKDILWSIPIVGVGKVKSLTFQAPQQAGIYPYVCSLPGHGFLMFGAMYVNDTETMPVLEKDIHIPPASRAIKETNTADHPYPLKPPYYYRTYVEGASPAAIIVRLPDDLAFCWDAGTCGFRFAWQGEFVDMKAIWKGHKDAKAEILGQVFYTEQAGSPIEIVGLDPKLQKKFKGYKLIEGGYLEFHYQIGQVHVYETLKESKETPGIIRTFRLENLKQPLYFNFTDGDQTTYYYQGKPLVGNRIELTAERAEEFSVILKIK